MIGLGQIFYTLHTHFITIFLDILISSKTKQFEDILDLVNKHYKYHVLQLFIHNILYSMFLYDLILPKIKQSENILVNEHHEYCVF